MNLNPTFPLIGRLLIVWVVWNLQLSSQSRPLPCAPTMWVSMSTDLCGCTDPRPGVEFSKDRGSVAPIHGTVHLFHNYVLRSPICQAVRWTLEIKIGKETKNKNKALIVIEVTFQRRETVSKQMSGGG